VLVYTLNTQLEVHRVRAHEPIIKCPDDSNLYQFSSRWDRSSGRSFSESRKYAIVKTSIPLSQEAFAELEVLQMMLQAHDYDVNSLQDYWTFIGHSGP
jgi:hypothetical protein